MVNVQFVKIRVRMKTGIVVFVPRVEKNTIILDGMKMEFAVSVIMSVHIAPGIMANAVNAT